MTPGLSIATLETANQLREANMADIEKRLKALEKRTRIDDERWQMLDAEIKALFLIFQAIGVPLCAADPTMSGAIIANLSTFESVARMQNEHARTIRKLRKLREFLVSQMEEIGKGDHPSSSNNDKPDRKK
jgi:hypothetical protein